MLKLDLNRKGTIAVIVQKDEAVTCSDENYVKYLESLDEDLLELDGDPTRFVLKKHLMLPDQNAVTDAKTGVDAKGNISLKLSFMVEDIRLSLLRVEGPKDSPLNFDFSKMKSKNNEIKNNLLAAMAEKEIIGDLFRARQATTEGHSDDTMKKKSPRSSNSKQLASAT